MFLCSMFKFVDVVLLLVAVEATEEAACGTLVCAVVGDFSEVGDALISASASGCWSASFEAPAAISALQNWSVLFEAPAAISALPRCSAEAGCPLGKLSKCGRGILPWFDGPIDN